MKLNPPGLLNRLLTAALVILLGASGVFAQSRALQDRMAIDSLQFVIDSMVFEKSRIDSLYEAERHTTAELRDQLIKLDDHRVKLRENITSFKDENLKLNQSNRILIVFNSLVAILLLITLVYFLKRIGKRKAKEQVKSNNIPVVPVVENHGRFVNLEDKLLQLERLGKLREKGILSEEEFLAEKSTVLGK